MPNGGTCGMHVCALSERLVGALPVTRVGVERWAAIERGWSRSAQIYVTYTLHYVTCRFYYSLRYNRPGEPAMQETDGQTDKLMRNERRGGWLGLVVVLVLAATLVLGSDTRRALLCALAIGIVFAVIWLGQQRTHSAKDTLQMKHEIVIHDESRQAAIAQAYKWGGSWRAGRSGFVLLGKHYRTRRAVWSNARVPDRCTWRDPVPCHLPAA